MNISIPGFCLKLYQRAEHSNPLTEMDLNVLYKCK